MLLSKVVFLMDLKMQLLDDPPFEIKKPLSRYLGTALILGYRWREGERERGREQEKGRHDFR
jgi:hypothetical protein